MKKYIIVFILILFMILPLFSALIELKNNYIKIIGDPETGRFIIKTTGGDPKLTTDQDVLLLYEDYPPTSFTTLRIDGRNYKFGDEMGTFITRLMKRDNKIICVWVIRNIEIMQNLRFVKGPTTGNIDTVEISYTIWNKDSREHTVGIRIMLDTYLGKEDGAPFRIPGVGPVTTEKAFEGDKIPEYWYSYDDLGNPTVRAQGTVKIEGTPVPDKIIYASWERFNKYLWDFTIKEGRSFRRSIIGPLDSAVAIYWKPRKFNPNDTFTVKTYYGLYGATIYKGKVFNISLGGPLTTSGEPFLVTADIQNVSPYKAKNVIAEIMLPKGLKLMNNETNKKRLGTLKSKEIKKTSWNILPDKTVTGIITYKVKVSGIVQGKLEIAIAERKVNYKGPKKEIIYTLYDFSEINKLIAEMNALLRKNNEKLDELNRLIQQKGPYSQKQAIADRKKINQRVNNTKKVKKKLPNAVKTAIKKSKK